MHSIVPPSRKRVAFQADPAAEAGSHGPPRALGRQKTLQGLVARTVGINSLLKGTRIKRMSDLALIDRSAVSVTATSAEELASLRLWEQGDEALYEREALAARYANRSNPEVWRILNQWWWVTLTQSRGEASQPPSAPRAAYLQMMVLVCKALLEEDEEWDEGEALRLSEAAWQEDARGDPLTISRSLFNDAIFELADMWTLTTEADEYIEWLKRLHGLLVDGVSGTFRPIEDVGSGAVRGLGSEPSVEERIKRHTGHRQRRASVAIQRKVRSRQGSRDFRAKRGAATQIQAAARGKPPRVDLSLKRGAATQIQAAARARPPRLGYRRKQAAAISIQAGARRIAVQKMIGRQGGLQRTAAAAMARDASSLYGTQRALSPRHSRPASATTRPRHYHDTSIVKRPSSAPYQHYEGLQGAGDAPSAGPSIAMRRRTQYQIQQMAYNMAAPNSRQAAERRWSQHGTGGGHQPGQSAAHEATLWRRPMAFEPHMQMPLHPQMPVATSHTQKSSCSAQTPSSRASHGLPRQRTQFATHGASQRRSGSRPSEQVTRKSVTMKGRGEPAAPRTSFGGGFAVGVREAPVIDPYSFNFYAKPYRPAPQRTKTGEAKSMSVAAYRRGVQRMATAAGGAPHEHDPAPSDHAARAAMYMRRAAEAAGTKPHPALWAVAPRAAPPAPTSEHRRESICGPNQAAGPPSAATVQHARSLTKQLVRIPLPRSTLVPTSSSGRKAPTLGKRWEAVAVNPRPIITSTEWWDALKSSCPSSPKAVPSRPDSPDTQIFQSSRNLEAWLNLEFESS